jgi:DNA-binding transcriptional regulator YdaS (Cro superfamily)
MSLETYIADMSRRRALAADLGIDVRYLWQMATGRRRIPAERVLPIEAITGISRHDLRPDIYPRERPARPAQAGVARG